ncbi:hypothetical protein OROMI_009961 [Orobanche minor]
MEAPPLSTHLPIPTTTTTTPMIYPDSVESSLRSRQTDSRDADAPRSQPPPNLRVMCSYGGHIIPRPHDRTLCYAGGDTRIVVIDRHTTLSELHHRLSKSLLHDQPFSLKYQLPNEDLDSLISVTTDEDLENMVDEYDRLNNSTGDVSKRGRLRLFLFSKPSSSIEQPTVETASTKSEDWFLDALNRKSSTLSASAGDRGFSESSSVNCLLGLDDDFVGKAAAVVEKDVETQIEGSKIGGDGNGIGNIDGNHVINQDVHSVPDSPMLETSSSFGSASSSPSVANLPPIRFRLDENQKLVGMGIEEQFQQIRVANVNVPPPLKREEIGVYMAAAGVAAGRVVSGVPVVVSGEYANRVISDDERSDHGRYGKVQQVQPLVQAPLQQHQIPQFQQKPTSAFDLASPDSVSSEGSVTNPLSRQRQAIYQEPVIQIQPANTKISTDPIDIKTLDQNNTKVQIQPQVREPGYILSGQYDQNHPQAHNHPQTFIHASNQYVSAGALPIPSYYTIYPPQHQHHQHPQHPILDHRYPIYYVSSRQNQTNPPPAAVPQMAYNQTGSNPAHYVGFAQVSQPSLAPNSSYAYEFADPNHGHMYYNHPPPQLAAQYQAGVVVPDSSREVPAENVKQS